MYEGSLGHMGKGQLKFIVFIKTEDTFSGWGGGWWGWSEESIGGGNRTIQVVGMVLLLSA